jgi:hypothetical protein
MDDARRHALSGMVHGTFGIGCPLFFHKIAAPDDNSNRKSIGNLLEICRHHAAALRKGDGDAGKFVETPAYFGFNAIRAVNAIFIFYTPSASATGEPSACVWLGSYIQHHGSLL